MEFLANLPFFGHHPKFKSKSLFRVSRVARNKIRRAGYLCGRTLGSKRQGSKSHFARYGRSLCVF